MKSKLKFAVVAGVLALSVGAGFAYAAMSADEAIKARQACMKAHGEGTFKIMLPMVKGEKPYDGATVQKALDDMGKDCSGWADYWPKDSMKSTTLKTHALEAIWTDPKGFEAASGAYYEQWKAMKATKDADSFKAGFKTFAGTCQGCHEKFRAPMN